MFRKPSSFVSLGASVTSLSFCSRISSDPSNSEGSTSFDEQVAALVKQLIE